MSERPLQQKWEGLNLACLLCLRGLCRRLNRCSNCPRENPSPWDCADKCAVTEYRHLGAFHYSGSHLTLSIRASSFRSFSALYVSVHHSTYHPRGISTYTLFSRHLSFRYCARPIEHDKASSLSGTHGFVGDRQPYSKLQKPTFQSREALMLEDWPVPNVQFQYECSMALNLLRLSKMKLHS